MEIVLVVLGILAFVGSFLLPGGQKGKNSEGNPLSQKEMKDMIAKEMQQIKSQVDGVAEEAVAYSMEKTERALERLSNEKIMAVSEYSDTVLKEIGNNHKEVMFLYDLLNEKQKSIKLTMAELLRMVKDVEAATQSMGFLEANTTAARSVPAGGSIPDTRQVTNGTGIPGGKPNGASSVTNAGQTTYGAVDAGNIGVNTAADRTNSRILFPGSQEPGGEQARSDDRQAQREGNRNGLVLELYQQGKSKVEIAKELGLGVGEVKLVLDLFQK
jgi:hypothetical protein